MVRAMVQGRSGLYVLSFCLCILLIPVTGFGFPAVPGEYVVKLRQPLVNKSKTQLAPVAGLPVVDVIRDDLVVVKNKFLHLNSQLILKNLQMNPAVARVEPNYIYKIVRMPNDPDYSKLWGLNNAGLPDAEGRNGVKNVDISAEKAWDLSTGSRNVVVAVIDTGLDYTHPDLADNTWVNDIEKSGQRGIDDDGNGYVDDIHGYDFANADSDPMDDHGHGTHCSGTIGASGDNGQGLVGVNWNVRIMGVKFLTAAGGGTLAAAVKAIDYATKMKVNIMSNSWGGGGPSVELQEAIERARAAGILFLAAAGNDATDNDVTPTYPSSYPIDNILSVAAVGNQGELAYFSSFGAKSVHIAAPGLNILSTIPGGQDTYSGTSMATPHAAGVAALLLGYLPNLTYKEVKERLIRTAKPLLDLKGRVSSGGMVDAWFALTDTTPPPDVNDPTFWPGRQTVSASTPHPYAENTTQSFSFSIPGAKRFVLHFPRFETETGYDRVVFTNAAGETVATMSGRRNDGFSPVILGDSINVTFTTDRDTNAYGFDVDFIAYE